MSTLRSAVIRLAHMNPSLRGALLSTLRSASSDHAKDYFGIFKARDGQWYGQAMVYNAPYFDLGEVSEDEDLDDDGAGYGWSEQGPMWGPFPNSDATYEFLDSKYPSRRELVDDSGRSRVPRQPRSPV